MVTDDEDTKAAVQWYLSLDEKHKMYLVIIIHKFLIVLTEKSLYHLI